MLLAIDVGNSQIVLGIYRGTKLIKHFRLESSSKRTIDEYHITISQLMQLADIGPADVQAAIMASVVPALGDTLALAVKRAFGVDVMVVGPGIKTRMPVLYDNPKEVGADRIVNAVAAFELAKQGAIVVDFGTATTFDCVSPKGEYMGGVIAPGMVISAEALTQRTAKLPDAAIAKPPRVLGKNTIHSMQSGLTYGYVGLVDGLVQRLQNELGFPCTVLATGGLAHMIQPESKTIERIEEHLTLDGLRILYERNC